jgi:hypothetical protein
MQVNEMNWSDAEQQIAQNAFQKAYERETSGLIKDVRDHAGVIAQLEDVWRLHDFLSARRYDIDGKYDYDYASLLFIFAKLLKEGYLHLDDLRGLDPSKLAKISALARM